MPHNQTYNEVVFNQPVVTGMLENQLDISTQLQGEEGLSPEQYAMTHHSVRVLAILGEEMPHFWRNFILRGGFALYHTAYSQSKMKESSLIGNVLRWTADIDLESLTELDDRLLHDMESVLASHGYRITSREEGQKGFANLLSMRIRTPEGLLLELDILDSHRTTSLCESNGDKAISFTTIQWTVSEQLSVSTHCVEEIVAKKLLIRFYHRFRPQDALDLFYVLSYMQVDETRVKAAFLAELALWAGDEQLAILSGEYGAEHERLVDWLVHFSEPELVDKIMQRVTMRNIEVLFDNRYHIIDLCRQTLQKQVRTLLRLNAAERQWFRAMLAVRARIVPVFAYRRHMLKLATEQQHSAMSSLLPRSTCEELQKRHEHELSEQILQVMRSRIGEEVNEALQELIRADDRYTCLNAEYLRRSMELHIQSYYDAQMEILPEVIDANRQAGGLPLTTLLSFTATSPENGFTVQPGE
jgi:predicted nucleotidyltransferase component of viral defense system